MDHSVDLEADPVIRHHLIEIEHLMLDPIPVGLGLSERYNKFSVLLVLDCINWFIKATNFDDFFYLIWFIDLISKSCDMRTGSYALTPLQLKQYAEEKEEHFFPRQHWYPILVSQMFYMSQYHMDQTNSILIIKVSIFCNLNFYPNCLMVWYT